jgi:hypothetical protein
VATALVAGLLGLFGTVVGGVLATWTVRQTADRSERRAREELRRQEYRSAVIRFATALLAYRLAEIDLWFARHGGKTDEGAMAAEAYRTRALAWNAFYELDFSTDRRDLVQLARQALETAFSIRKPDTEGEMTKRSYQTRKALAAVIEAARDVQPGAEVGTDTKELLTDA